VARGRRTPPAQFLERWRHPPLQGDAQLPRPAGRLVDPVALAGQRQPVGARGGAGHTRARGTHGANESTYWLYFELLWREFFFWRALETAAPCSARRPRGTTPACHRCTFEPRNFARWCAGDTDYPLVNACMRQLLATGWMSNRGRQIAASCLVHDYGIDWRYGAAFFEKHLIDYDVASNYGNWQYIAGVGADPAAAAHFNIEKQTAQYDPRASSPPSGTATGRRSRDYVTDAADWPLSRRGLSAAAPPRQPKQTPGGEDLPGLRAPVSLAGALEKQLGRGGVLLAALRRSPRQIARRASPGIRH
jgi:hypothetical protein